MLQINDVEGYRKFCNKLWNATKFCMFKLDMVDIDGARLQSDFVPNKTDAVRTLHRPDRKTDPDGVVAILFQKSGNETLAERWIFHKLNQTAIKVNKAFEARIFNDVTETIHGFWLYELCDVFIVRQWCFSSEKGASIDDCLYYVNRRLPSPSQPMRLLLTSRSLSRTLSTLPWSLHCAWYTP